MLTRHIENVNICHASFFIDASSVLNSLSHAGERERLFAETEKNKGKLQCANVK